MSTLRDGIGLTTDRQHMLTIGALPERRVDDGIGAGWCGGTPERVRLRVMGGEADHALDGAHHPNPAGPPAVPLVP
jgi:hypothetical protein